MCFLFATVNECVCVLERDAGVKCIDEGKELFADEIIIIYCSCS